MTNKTDIDSILLANWYFINCIKNGVDCSKTETARKYLTLKINKALNDRQRSRSIKAFSFFKSN